MHEFGLHFRATQSYKYFLDKFSILLADPLFHWCLRASRVIGCSCFFPTMTKIIGTLGFHSRSVDAIFGCLNVGMFVSLIESFLQFYLFSSWDGANFLIGSARFYFLWHGEEYHRKTLKILKDAIKSSKKLFYVCILIFLEIFNIIWLEIAFSRFCRRTFLISFFYCDVASI